MNIPNKLTDYAGPLVAPALFAGITILRPAILTADTAFGISTGQKCSTNFPGYTSFPHSMWQKALYLGPEEVTLICQLEMFKKYNR